MIMTFTLMASLSFANVTEQDVESALADSIPSSSELEGILNAATQNGEIIGDLTNPEFIHKMYHIKNDGDADKDIFSTYKSGSFSGEFDTGNYYWMIPQFEGDSAVKEYYYYPGAVKTSGVSEIKGNMSGLRIIYSYDELSTTVSKANIGTPQSIKRAIITYPSPTIFLYISTDKGEYIIPMLSSLGVYYNMYNEDKISIEPLSVYTADEFVELYKKETQGKKQQAAEYEANNEDKPSSSVNEDSEVVENTPSPTPATDVNKTPETTPTPETNQTPEATPTSESNETPETTPTPNYSETLSSEDKADVLNDAGLFKGTNNGYELDKTFTRAEGATMLVRLIGAESDALNGTYDVVFIDVPEDSWAFPYVMYAYDNDIVKGTSAETYTPDREMTGAEFATLLLRMLGKTEAEPSTALALAVEEELITEIQYDDISNSDTFKRESMINLAYNVYLKIK